MSAHPSSARLEPALLLAILGLAGPACAPSADVSASLERLDRASDVSAADGSTAPDDPSSGAESRTSDELTVSARCG